MWKWLIHLSGVWPLSVFPGPPRLGWLSAPCHSKLHLLSRRSKCVFCAGEFRAVKQGKCPRKKKRKEKKNPFKQKKCSWVIRDWESKLKLWMWSLASVPVRAAFRATGPGNFQATFDKLAPLWFAFTPHNKLHLPLSLERQNNPLKGVYFRPTTRLKKDPKGICTWDKSPCLGLGGILGRHLAPCIYHRGIHYWHTHVSL